MDCSIIPDEIARKSRTVRLNTLGLSHFETVVPPDRLTVEVNSGHEVHTLDLEGYVTFNNQNSGLQYRSGKMVRYSEVIQTFETDHGMPEESENEAAMRE